MINVIQLLLRRLRRPLLMGALLAASVAAHGQNCTFRTVGSALNFPSLDPSAAGTVTAFMDVNVKCVPAILSPTWSFSGANGSAPLQMKHSAQNVYIPYTITTTFIGGNVNETWRISGTILGVNYQNAWVGSYTDILTATVTP